MDYLAAVIWSLAPTVLIGSLFGLLLRSIVTADRQERRAYAKIEREERERLGLLAPEPPAAEKPAA